MMHKASKYLSLKGEGFSAVQEVEAFIAINQLSLWASLDCKLDWSSSCLLFG